MIDANGDEMLPVDILLVVVAVDEFYGVFRQLQPLPNRQGVIRVFRGTQTYMVGRFGVYAAALVKLTGEDVPNIGDAQITISQAIAMWQSKATIMIGAALGLKPNEQQLGDVMVSSLLGPFTVAQGVVIRGEYVAPGVNLSPRFDVSGLIGWHFKRYNDGNDVKVHRGLLFSGPLNAKTESALLRSSQKQTVGFDKEGDGVVTAAISSSNEWIVVKGICGFVGASLTKEHVPFAVAAAVSAVKHILSRHCLSDLGCVDVTKTPPPSSIASATSAAATTTTTSPTVINVGTVNGIVSSTGNPTFNFS
jgi:nucleoside phosphorylase